MDHWDTIASERRSLADDLEGLTDAQWETKSLCGEWTVRQLAGHLVVPHTTPTRTLIVEMVKAAGNFNKVNSKLARRQGERPTTELVADIRRYADGRFTPPGFGSVAPLTDILIHGYDARIPLGLPSTGASDRFADSLDLLVTSKAKRAFTPKTLPPLKFVATDLDWSHGDGDEVHGAAADLALTMSGRRARIDALTGPGVPAFASWLPI
jgi:uncharacterized protein (TIGR03083 family)